MSGEVTKSRVLNKIQPRAMKPEWDLRVYPGIAEKVKSGTDGMGTGNFESLADVRHGATADYSETDNAYIFDVEKRKWINYGSASLVRYGDTSFVDLKYEKKVENIKYFAVVPGGTTAKFNVVAVKEHNDLYFYFR